MNKGFSLVELIVVIAIMAILVGVAVPVYTGYIDKANANVDKQYLGELEAAINTVYIEFKANPDLGAIPAELTLANGELTATAVTGKSFTNFENAVKAIIAAKDVKLDSNDPATFSIADGKLTYSCDKLAD
jgi:prepilin-type N-terminal cleavage/methylation domain-containing protein